MATIRLLRPTVHSTAPLVVGDAPVQPPLSGTRLSTVVEREGVGRVEGLATVLPLPEVAATPAPLPPPPRPRRLPAVTPTPQAPLTEATDDYVGEAQEPAQPHRAPGWLRHVPEWMKPESIPSNIPAVLPPPEPPALIPEPPRIAEVTPAPAPERPTPRRRPSLGQTRRLGLGAPLPPPDPEPQPTTPARTGFPYTMDGLRKHEPPGAAPQPDSAQSETPQPSPATPWGPLPAPGYPPPTRQEGVTGGLWTTSPPSEGSRPSLAEALRFALPDQPEGGPPDLQHPPATEPPPAPPQAADVVRAEVPQDIAQDVGRVTGTDLSTVPVFRGPAVDAAAQERGARAFARADAVFLPDAAGPVTTPKARALIAHELVHVAQQRVHGRVPDGAQGRRMEAEPVAVERWYETTTAAGPELHHPPAPAPAPELAGPAQLAPTYATAPPDPAHSHFDVPAREEIVQLAESSAHRVVEEWSNPATGGSGFRNPTSPAPAFDRATRRQELEAEMLDEINADRAATGEPLLSGLEPQHVERLERRLDHEEITGERRGGRSSGSRTPLPPLVGGAFGDTVSFTETIGGQQQQQAQQTPAQRNQQVQEALRQQEAQRQAQAQQQQQRTAPGRAGLAAALTGAAVDEDGRLPATEGGVLGDTVSFTERRGADRYPGGKPPQDAAKDDRHGSEQEQIDLDRVDLEDLTNRLYDRLRGRLRLELLVDRERAGFLTDFR
ncbi:hypothetical protein GCM10023148_28660 [Actinokineospora soli]